MRQRRNEIAGLSNLSPNNLENMFSVLIDEDNNYFYDLTDTLYLETDSMNPLHFIEYDIRMVDTLYSLSKNFYDTYNLWWVIAVSNNIDDPFELESMVGQEIKIINREVVGRILSFLDDV